MLNISRLKPSAPFSISYPGRDFPGVPIKLGTRVQGAGADGDIVAFSTLCPHKGFPPRDCDSFAGGGIAS